MNIDTDKFSFFINAIRSNRLLRRKMAQYSHPLFNAIYLPRPLEVAVPMAEFQREIFKLTEDKKVELCLLAGFRGCGKTSLCTVSFPIWAVLSGQAHFIVIVSQTRAQARSHFANIKRQLEENPLLKNDFGPFDQESDEWGAYAITSKKYDARIIAVSTDQAIRGALYKHYRPDLIICDDIEDLQSTKTQESRDRIFNWFNSEIVPLGTHHTRIFVLGNFLHEFSLVGRLMAQIESGERDGVSKRYPLLDATGKCLWPGMYPDNDSIEAKRRKIGDDAVWSREYLLTFISSFDKLVPHDWIHYYEPGKTPAPEGYHCLGIFSAADLAISTNPGSDFTAIVSAKVYVKDNDLKIYILPNPINKRLNFPDAIETMKELLDTLGQEGPTKLFVESVGFQQAYYEVLFENGYTQVEPVKVTQDKRTRLELVTRFIKDGTILFPEDQAKDLVTQLIGFGKELHDDLVDSMTMLVRKILENHSEGRPMRNWFSWVRKNGGMFVDLGNSRSLPKSSYRPLLPERRRIQSLMDDAPEQVPSKYLGNEEPERASPVPPPVPRDARDDAAGSSLQNHLRDSGPRQDVSQIIERRSSPPPRSSSGSNDSRSSGGYSGGSSSGYSGGGYSSGGSSSSGGGSSRGNSSRGGGSIGGMLGGAARRRFGND